VRRRSHIGKALTRPATGRKIVDSAGLEQNLRYYFPFGFATSLQAWQRYVVDELLEPVAPLAQQSTAYTVRKLADRINARHADLSYTTPPVFAEHLIALGALTDALRYLARQYCLQDRPGALARGREHARDRIGRTAVTRINPVFGDLFPPGTVQTGQATWQRFLSELTGPVEEHLTLEVILLFLNVRNRATRSFRELFDDGELQRRASYVPFVVAIEEFFEREEPAGRTGMKLFEFLRAPALASPDSLDGQLAFIREHWADLLPADLLARIDQARDVLRETDARRTLTPGSAPVLEFGLGTAGAYDGWPEPESFSSDADWMSNVVLMAKSSYVWLDQLSKWYQRPIATLADIPDEELDRLAGWGVTGLWLIGLWERSRASQTIKQWTGNPEAGASAYSLYEYEIAADLGGPAAYDNLRERAAARGIRLASDMVPNHMGIDSRWLIEHPDWFLQLDCPPYPAYSFNGGDLCGDERVSIRIEDGYWEQRDAAVVFQRRDDYTGNVRYIYHGNDGTSMPWNDTAQLDFSRADVREAVIQTILHVARQFPIIRFDAAMTLAKKHFQRLWFPSPGDAGAIPSRAEHGLTREAFDRLVPHEFWREVVDRVAVEAPDTLLLAEAFWLMEGYFVRTLGMHRVYNSAFMNMLKMEENQKYRQTIKNVLEFSPEVLKRFVNFMSNPDERTAVEQFGKGDKYFGVSLMLITMPGLPMLGHGQVEGFSEKYGMEYRRAYWDEHIDTDMVRRHEREIFPLMRRRQLFSGAENFALFDFVHPDGHVDENVFAYTNRSGDDRALILYNNAYASTRGTLQTASAVNRGTVDTPRLESHNLAEALGLNGEQRSFYTFRDAVTGLEYLRFAPALAEHGLYIELSGYQYHAMVDFRLLHDHDGVWSHLHDHLSGHGTPHLARDRRELELLPLLDQFGELTGPERLKAWGCGQPTVDERIALKLDRLDRLARDLLGSARPSGLDPAAAASTGTELLDEAMSSLAPLGAGIPEAAAGVPLGDGRAGDTGSGRPSGTVLDALCKPTAALLSRGFAPPIAERLADWLGESAGQRLLPVVWIGRLLRRTADAAVGIDAATDTGTDPPLPGKPTTESVPGAADERDTGDTALALLDADAVALLLDRARDGLQAWLRDDHTAWELSRLAWVLARHTPLSAAAAFGHAGEILEQIAADPEGRALLGLNTHADVWYLRQESLKLLLAGELYLALPAILAAGPDAGGERLGRLIDGADIVDAAADQHSYRLTKTVTALNQGLTKTAPD